MTSTRQTIECDICVLHDVDSEWQYILIIINDRNSFSNINGPFNGTINERNPYLNDITENTGEK